MIKITNIKDNGYFTLELLRTSGEPFVKIHGCKVVDYSKGAFVSGPAFKGRDEKWINHTWMDDKLQAQVIEAVLEARGVNKVMDDIGEVPF